MILHGLRSNGRLGIEMMQIRRPLHCGHIMRFFEAESGILRPHVQTSVSRFSSLMELPRQMGLVDSAVDAFRMDAQPAVIASPRVSMGMRTIREQTPDESRSQSQWVGYLLI
jgi:hypothetical protein